MIDSEKAYLYLTISPALLGLGHMDSCLQSVNQAFQLVHADPIPSLMVHIFIQQYLVYLSMGALTFLKLGKQKIDSAYTALQGHDIKDELAYIRICDALFDLYIGRPLSALEKAQKPANN
jgi:hypothetical protein